MTDQQTYETLFQAAVDEPDEPLHRLALADWYGERGDTLRQEAWLNLVGKKPLLRESYWWHSYEWKSSRCAGTPGYIESLLEDGWVRQITKHLYPDANWDHKGNELIYHHDLIAMYRAAVEAYVAWKEENK